MLVSALTLLIATVTSPSSVLWQIGKPDGSPNELGLAPGGYQRYATDPVYIVGSSKDRDWPYVLPGPSDSWAKNKAHAGDIYFGLSGVVRDAKCRLVLNFSDTQSTFPPKLELLLNGTQCGSWQAPAGSGDDVIEGHASSGKRSQWSIELPGKLLRSGNNVLAIRNVRGSWAIFDSLELEASGSLKLAPVQNKLDLGTMPQRQAIVRTNLGPRQPVLLDVVNIGPVQRATVFVEGGAAKTLTLQTGRQSVEVDVSPVKSARQLRAGIQAGRVTVYKSIKLVPVRPWTVYLFPHSHVDIGYTNLQPYILKLHERNLMDVLEVAKQSAKNPKDSRYRFSLEATWVADQFFQTATAEQRAAVAKAVRDKTISISGDYANELTGVMHPEELMQSYRYANLLEQRLGATIDTASQTDVPGATWGDVVALHEAGIKYLVLMPNGADRIGGVRSQWENKPFYWVGPSGQERVLVWEPDTYSVGVSAGWDGNREKIYRTSDPAKRFIQSFIFDKLDLLVASGYPYDLIGEPWSVTDNAPIDGDVPEAAKAWNKRYVFPHVVVSTLSDACHELVRRYGKQIPVVKGDLTPYWEDGTGSSAAETAINRETPERLLQASALYAMLNPRAYPASGFLKAWRNVVLYSEHTWGAWNSVSSPDDPAVKAQWAIKRAFAIDGESQSKALLKRALSGSEPNPAFVDVLNTNSWDRTDLVTLSLSQSKAGDRVEDENGKPLPSQRLKSGELVVLVRNVPAFSSKRLRIKQGAAYVESSVRVDGNTIRSSQYEIVLDPTSKAISSVKDLRLGRELASKGAPYKLNQFLYLPDADLKGLQTSSNASSEIVERGPLVATLRVRSSAPQTEDIVQEIRLVAGLDRIELTDRVDKLPVRTKEGVHFSFPLNVPAGQMRIDMPWALVRPETDQMAGANKNWLPTQGYVDVSNSRYGVTCVSCDAPLIEVGEISANVMGGQYNPAEWRQHIAPTQTFYSWALNNHWYTNYLADQSGPLTFRYVLRGHGAFRSDEASRFGVEARQPLLVTHLAKPNTESLLKLNNPSVLVTSLSPSDDGHALIIRLWGATAGAHQVRLHWRSGLVKSVWNSNLSQKALSPCGDTIEVPGWGVRTLRIELNRPAH